MEDFELDLSAFDTSQLSAERDILRAADRLVEDVLRQVGERKARRIWNSALRIVRECGDAPLIEDGEEYVRRTVEEYVLLSAPHLRDAYRKVIERRLRDHIKGHVSLPAGMFGPRSTILS